MIHPESKSATTGSERVSAGSLERNGDNDPGARITPDDELNEPIAFRGVIAIDVPREVIARFSGKVILTELPERQPEVIFDSVRQFWDDDNE